MQENANTIYRNIRLAATGATAMLALGLLVLLPSAPPAQAANLASSGTNASLVFSPTFVGGTQMADLCVDNLSGATVQGELVIRDDLGVNHHAPYTIQPGALGVCLGFQPEFGAQSGGNHIRASIQLQSPVQCSQSTEYPGKCGVVGSLEIEDAGVSAITNRIHMEPVLLPGSPGNPKLTNLPQ